MQCPYPAFRGLKNTPVIHKASQAPLGDVFLTVCYNFRRLSLLLTLSSVEITRMDIDDIFWGMVEFWVGQSTKKEFVNCWPLAQQRAWGLWPSQGRDTQTAAQPLDFGMLRLHRYKSPFVWGPFSEAPSQAVNLLFSYFAKIKWFHGSGCLRLWWETWCDCGNLGVQLHRGLSPCSGGVSVATRQGHFLNIPINKLFYPKNGLWHFIFNS